MITDILSTHQAKIWHSSIHPCSVVRQLILKRIHSILIMMPSQKFVAIVAGEEKEDETDKKKGRNRASWSGSVVCSPRCFVTNVHDMASSLMGKRQWAVSRTSRVHVLSPPCYIASVRVCFKPSAMFDQDGSRRWMHFQSALQLAIQRSARKWT